MTTGKETRITPENNEKKEYTSANFWNELDLNSDPKRMGDLILEKNFMVYLTYVSRMNIEAADKCIVQQMKRLSESREWTKVFLKLAEKTLYDIESPWMNEAMYVPFVRSALETEALSGTEREKYEFQLKMASKNNPLQVATDFSYIDPQGRQRTLHETVKRNTILMFSDPECEACKEATRLLMKDEIVSGLTGSGEMDIVLIYTEGDEEVWKQIKDAYPKTWTVGFDREEKIKMEGLYNLRAMPTLYFIGGNSMVYLKDKTADVLIDFLKEHAEPK